MNKFQYEVHVINGDGGEEITNFDEAYKYIEHAHGTDRGLCECRLPLIPLSHLTISHEDTFICLNGMCDHNKDGI